MQESDQDEEKETPKEKEEKEKQLQVGEKTGDSDPVIPPVPNLRRACSGSAGLARHCSVPEIPSLSKQSTKHEGGEAQGGEKWEGGQRLA